MRTLTTAFFGAALAVSAFALSGAPASAIETHLVVSGAGASAVTLADWSPRCRRWHHYCEERHPMSRFKYRGCLALHGCAS
jgi:Spy/CpxP family protein refolding chaperone